MMNVRKLLEALRMQAEWAMLNDRIVPITLAGNLSSAADLIEAQQKKIDQLMTDLMASVNGELGGKFTPGEAFKLTEYYKGEKCTMCKHFGGVKGKHLAEDLPEDHGKNCWKCNCNFEWVPPEERTK